jgi:uncharacterized protein YPO0396
LQAQVQQLQEKKATEVKQESTPHTEEDEIDMSEADNLYPEITGPFKKLIAKMERQLTSVTKELAAVKSDAGTLKNEFGEVKSVADQVRKDKALTAEEKHYAAIAEKHPDWVEIVNSPEYADWLPEQAPFVQAALKQGSARDVVTAFNIFRAEHPKAEPVPETRVDPKPVRASAKADKLAAARAADTPDIKSVQTRDKKPTFTNAQIAKMSDAEYAKNEAAIDEALARGEIQ